MTTQARVLPDLDEALDWDPTCQTEMDHCDRPATWAGRTGCCGAQVVIVCDEHRARNERAMQGLVFQCRECGKRGMTVDDITWRPL